MTSKSFDSDEVWAEAKRDSPQCENCPHAMWWREDRTYGEQFLRVTMFECQASSAQDCPYVIDAARDYVGDDLINYLCTRSGGSDDLRRFIMQYGDHAADEAENILKAFEIWTGAK